ncbi:MAG: enoyl-CoA hydratase/isomerase family protein [Calditrichaeota bacterium]|nr:enoyl-CoA hydratase/isomerase family protein [Calditrichota bacterium]
MDSHYIKIDPDDHRLDIILSHPPVNILTGAVMKEMIRVLQDASSDPHLRAVVIRSEGKAWSAGADVSEHLPGQFEPMLDTFGELCELVRTYPVPTVAAVDGLCLGGGCELALMCDFVLASERAKFGQPEIKVGVFPPAACAHFAMKMGWQNAMEVILTGDVFSAEDAAKMKLATKVFPVDRFSDEVDRFVDRIICNSGVVLRVAKRAALEGMRLSPEMAAQESDRIYRQELMTMADAVEGLNAFMEKREPNWKDN